MKDFVNNVCGNFKKFYNPHEFLVVDEGIIFNTYKEISLSCGLRSYTLDLNFSEDPSQVDPNIKSNHNLNDDIIKSILRHYNGKAHKVILDNYHSNINLVRELKEYDVGILASISH